MKIYIFPFFAISMFLIHASVEVVYSQGGGAITIEADATNNDALVKIPDNVLPNTFSGTQNYLGTPYYQIFLVYGDGNYYLRAGEMRPSTGLIYQDTNPFLSSGSNSIGYLSESLLASRKSDTPPPFWEPVDEMPSPVIPISSSNPVDFININDSQQNKSQALIPEVNDITTDCERIALDHSFGYLEEEGTSSFIVAYHPIDDDYRTPVPGIKQEVLLFYSGSFNDPSVNQPQIHLPNYFPGSSPSALQASSVDPASKYLGLGTGFQHALKFSVPESYFSIDNDVDGIEELRLFHFLEANPSLSTNSDYEFLALMVSEQPNPCAASNFSDDSGFIAPYVDPASFKLRVIQPNGMPLFYVDADTINLKSGKPKDPNYLKIIDVCKCGTSDNLKLTFELQFCNISRYPTSSSTIYLKQQDRSLGKFSCFNPIVNKSSFGISGKAFDRRECAAAASGNCKDCTNKEKDCHIYDHDQHSRSEFCVEYDAIYKEKGQVPGENCHKFIFTAETNEDVWGAIIKGDFDLLEACVNFHETDCELVCSQIKETAIFSTTPIPNCSDKNVTCEDCDVSPVMPCWQIVAGILATFAVGFVLYRIINRRRKNPANPSGGIATGS
ncbi:MAG: hypothetical protein AAF502_23355 [Bacteroidota bacterium]